jgi:hypothetical protein
MKTFIAFCAAILVAAATFVPPPCTTFDDNQLDGWTFDHAHGGTQAGHGGYYADVNDSSGASHFDAPKSYHGDWLKFVSGCGQLCFDVNIINDGLTTSNPVSVAFTIFNGTQYATFVHTPVVEGSGWHTFCAPIEAGTGGIPPNNGQGTWNLGGGATWPAILGAVTDFSFSVDFAGSGAQTEHFQIDNICFKANTCAKAEFTFGPLCAGVAGHPTDQSTGATSWNWTFGAGSPPTATGQSPNVAFPAGTHPVTLCINGGSPCVTHNVIVNPVPAIPIISGPTTTCQNPASYCVTNPQAGVTYTWSATSGSVSPAAGTCTSVNWNTPGVLTVTATNQYGCKSVKRIEVTGCQTNNPCCDKPQFKIDSWSMPYTGGHYVFTPVINTAGGLYKRVEIDIISAGITYSSASCGSPHTFLPAITGLHPVTGFTPWQPVLNSTNAVFYNMSGAPISLLAFPVDVALPPHSGLCDDVIHFCVKYTLTDDKCRTCVIYQCYDFKRPPFIEPPPDDNDPT